MRLAANLARIVPVLLLAGCSGGSHSFPPPCPTTAILGDAADFATYHDPKPGGGRDLTDLVLQGRITGINGKCSWGGSTKVMTDISVGLDIGRGPATDARVAQIAYFVSVLRGDQILDKKVFPIRVQFPANSDRLRIQTDPVTLALPSSRDVSSAAFKVLVGFQVTPEQLAENRQHPSH